MKGHRPQGLHAKSHLIDHTQQAVGAAHRLQQFGLVFGDLENLAGREDRLEPDGVGGDGAVLVRERSLLRVAASGRAHAEVAQFDVDVKLEAVLFQFLRHVLDDRPCLGDDPILADVQDTAHAAHIDGGARLGHDRSRSPNGSSPPRAPAKDNSPGL